MNDHPVARTHMGARLDRASWLAAFRGNWSMLAHHYFQFERLQLYAEPENLSLQAFHAGDLDAAARIMEDAVVREEGLFLPLCCRPGYEMTSEVGKSDV